MMGYPFVPRTRCLDDIKTYCGADEILWRMALLAACERLDLGQLNELRTTVHQLHQSLVDHTLSLNAQLLRERFDQ